MLAPLWVTLYVGCSTTNRRLVGQMAATEGFEGAFVTEVIGDDFRINTSLPR